MGLGDRTRGISGSIIGHDDLRIRQPLCPQALGQKLQPSPETGRFIASGDDDTKRHGEAQ
jgi:hypothetical protein